MDYIVHSHIEDYCLLGCDTAQSYRSLPTIWRNLGSWQAKLFISLFPVLLFEPADGSSMFIWNIGGYLLDYMTLSIPEDSASRSQCWEDLGSNVIDGSLPNKAWC
jgi:hypothetical protein